MGDMYIKTAAGAIKNTVRNEDVVARIGGDEFVVLLPETDKDTTKNICKRIKNNFINKNVDLPEELSISLGTVTADNNKMDINIIYEQADYNMYKNKGRR